MGAYLSPILRHDYVTQAELRVAFARLTEVPLDRIESRLAARIPVTIPDTPEWRHIRRVWGPPDYMITAVSSSKNVAYCFSDVGLAIDIQRQGEQIATAAGGLPYGYSFYSGGCAVDTFHFRAEPGNELTITITKSNTRPLPSGELIIEPSWYNTKDKIVGVMLAEDFRRVIPALLISGTTLVLPAVFVLLRRFRQRDSEAA